MISYNTSIVRNGLILHLDAANSKSYPGSGTTWTDLSGRGNHTTVSAGAFNSNGYFESTGDAPSQLFFFTPPSTSISSALSVTTGGWTIEENVLVDDTTYPESTAGTTFSAGNASAAGIIGIDWAHGTQSPNFINVTLNDGTTLLRTNLTLNPIYSQYDNWVHRTFVYDRTLGELRIYYNGVYQGLVNISSVTGSVYNGASISWGTLYGWHHDGFRAGMKIYNRILSLPEIRQNFEATRGRYGI
jgi:hypothetical protein